MIDPKTRFKNDAWRVNYAFPFVRRHLSDSLNPLTKAVRIAGEFAGKRAVRARGRRRSVGADTLQLMREIAIEIDEESLFAYSIDEKLTLAVPGNVFSNFTLDYGQIVNGSLADLFRISIGDGSDEFGREQALVWEALRALRDRMIRALPKRDAGWDRRAALEGMFERPAESFFEGLQRVLFLNQAMWQTRHRLNGLGRLDKMLGPLYERDVAAGNLDERSAAELVDAFYACLHSHYGFKSDMLVGDIGQIIVLGGVEPDGGYFRNALTNLFLERQAACGYPDPKVFLRVSAAMPADLMDKAVDALLASTGSPLLSNDDRVIPVLEGAGVTHADACAYCVSACWEPLVPGRSIGQNNMRVFDACEPLADAIDEAGDAASYEDILHRYEASLKRRFEGFLDELDDIRWAEDPLASAFYPDCVRQRLDISEGGARYRNYGVTTVGIANTVDSLLNLKGVLGSRVRSMAQVKGALARGFSDDPVLLGALAGMSWFGRDVQAAIDLTNEITGILDAVAAGYENPLGGGVKFGLSSPDYIKRAGGCPADLSGRAHGEPYTVHISNPGAAYTELVGFASALDYSGHRFNGNVVDFFIAPGLIRENRGKFASFLRSAVGVGFFQMQMNVLDCATLVEAREHPELYPGLIVRVWGFSAYFNDLPDPYKDYLIERARETEAARWA